MNRLPLNTCKLLLSMLVEGSSMRSIARKLDISFNTVQKMLQDAGTACDTYPVRNVESERVQCDGT